ncbi:MAG: response regulator transcription factor [Methylophilus sp.]|nr:response regulator transcription factor [Methylophilus sp.]
MTSQLLLIEDDAHIFQFLVPSLSAKGFHVKHALTKHQAEALLSVNTFDIVILDLGLPDGKGEDVIRAIRAISDVPILILSAKQEESDKVNCLNLGADDYLVKPFGIDELVARIRASLRRSAMMTMRDHEYQHEGLTINRVTGIVTKHNKEVHLSPIEHQLLMMLAAKPGSIVTHSQLLAGVWGQEYLSDTHYLRIHIGRLRAKIEDVPATPEYILTELGIGYRLI